MKKLPNNIPTKDELQKMFRMMVTIRETENTLLASNKAGNTPGQVHLSNGQEAICVGISSHLTDEDQITSNHRGHGHFLEKGGNLKAMFSEIYGMADGVCGGMGGSMHVADLSKGIVGANGIVGGGISIATGVAFAKKLDGSNHIVVTYFGDGASNQGVLMECLNITALWKLPLLFVCENNGYSEFSPTKTVTKGDISMRAKPFGIPIWQINGNEIIEVWQTGQEAIEHIRSGGGPAFIEAKTWRQSGHFSRENLVLQKPYRTEEEEKEGLADDPIIHLTPKIDGAELIMKEVKDEVERASKAALMGSPPASNAAKKLMFSDTYKGYY